MISRFKISLIMTAALMLLYGSMMNCICALPETVSISFKNNATVNDTAIFLKDISTIESSSSIADLLKTIQIGRSAPPGFSRSVDVQNVVTSVLKRRFPDVAIDVLGPQMISVNTACLQVRVSELSDKIESCIGEKIKWPHSSWTVEVQDTASKIRCFDRGYTVKFSGCEEKYPRGNVRMTGILVQDNYSISFPVVCRIKVKIPVTVAARTIERGEVITPDCLKLSERDITVFRYEPLFSIDSVCGTVASRTISPLTIIHEAMLSAKPDVYKGDMVSISSESGTVKVSVLVRARENGCVGDRIIVENPESHKIFKIEITGRGCGSIVSREAS
jgi:flagella basal body P-ring formation protein FlgA